MLSYNGEIYNHAALRAELDQRGGGINWRGHSDTETLVEAIAAWGLEAALGKCVGMFALALWDRRSARCRWRATGSARSRFIMAGSAATCCSPPN
jgi:asparagine synthase (glutamine-hydrolysing)